MSQRARLQDMYERLCQFYGPQHWWPAESLIEMVVGAVLTQNTNWQNVQKAIDTIRGTGGLNFESLLAVSVDELASLIRSSGYYNLKARRLKNLLEMIQNEYEGSLDLLLSQDLQTARQSLLSVKGIGPETADSILLYAGGFPIFVVDAYTHRICSRHYLIEDECDYQSLQELFMDNLPQDADLFNEYHALLVKVAKEFCKKKQPLCDSCPLKEL